MKELLKSSDSAFYTFDISLLKKRIAYLEQHLPKDVTLCYAVKANTFIVGELKDTLRRFEICSPGEAEICDRLGVAPEKTVISGIYKTPSVIEKMVASSDGRIYTVESLTQFELLRSLSEKYGKTLPILLRLTNDSQFGINEEEIIEIAAKRESYPHLHLLGIQFFSGTQKNSLKKLRREIDRLDILLQKLQDSCGYAAEELEYGPGFPVAYFEGEDFDEEAFLAEFSAILDAMVCKPKLTLELGRSIAACCGSYYTHVVDVKRNKGQNYLLIDGGMHHLVYFGQHMAMKQPRLSVCGKEEEAPKELWNICGSLCSMNDLISKQTPLPKMEIGDTLCFKNTGAYCMTEGIALFLSRELPAVYLLKEDGSAVCARPSYETSALNMPS